MNKTPTNKGFILLEIIVYISIIIFLTFLSTNLLIKNNDLPVYLEIERLYAFALFLHKEAQLKQQTIKILFDSNKNKYSTNSQDYKLSNDVKFGVIKNAYGPPSKPTSIIKKPITFQNNTMIFYPDGTISAGIVYLTDKTEKVLYGLSAGVSAISYLRKYKFQKKWTLIN